MYNYSDIIQELITKASIPKSDVFDYSDSVIKQIFER
jgi:hypothetical protein